MSLSSLEFQRASAWRLISRQISRLVGRAARAIRSAWMRHRRHQQLRRELAQLAAMDDFSLRDIGISRTEIRAAIREGTNLEARSR
jgi:uncharacterized protein YjiS (DUF1127 family)